MKALIAIARYTTTCQACEQTINPGQAIKGGKCGARHLSCANPNMIETRRRKGGPCSRCHSTPDRFGGCACTDVGS